MQTRSLIVPVEDHFPARPSYRGSGPMKTLKILFMEKGLLDRAKTSKFGQFFTQDDLQFSGVMFHELMLRKVNVPDSKCVHFLLGDKTCRFGRDEFCLMTGLTFAEEPTHEEVEKHVSDDHLIRDYFNNKQNISLCSLLDVMNRCDDIEDLYKLGLCYFIEAVLYGNDKATCIWRDMLKFVNNLEFFFSYPWGKKSFNKLIGSCMKDMVYYKNKFQAKMEGQQKEAKYSLYGYVPALQYWAYEAIRSVGQTYGVHRGFKFPRMLSWSAKPKPQPQLTGKALRNLFTKNSVEVQECLKPRSNELDYYKSLIGDGEDIGVMVMEIETEEFVSKNSNKMEEVMENEILNEMEKSNMEQGVVVRMVKVEAKISEIEHKQDLISRFQSEVKAELISQKDQLKKIMAILEEFSSVPSSPKRTTKRPLLFIDYIDSLKTTKKLHAQDVGYQSSSDMSPSPNQGEIQRESLECYLTEQSNHCLTQPATQLPIAPPTSSPDSVALNSRTNGIQVQQCENNQSQHTSSSMLHETELEKIQREQDRVAKLHQQKKSMLLSECEKEISEVRKKYNALIKESEMSSMNQIKIVEEYYKLVNTNNQLTEFLAGRCDNPLNTPLLKKTVEETSPVKILEIPASVLIQPANPFSFSSPSSTTYLSGHSLGGSGLRAPAPHLRSNPSLIASLPTLSSPNTAQSANRIKQWDLSG